MHLCMSIKQKLVWNRKNVRFPFLAGIAAILPFRFMTCPHVHIDMSVRHVPQAILHWYFLTSPSKRLNSTNSMEQNPSWEANSHSVSQEIPYLLRSPKVHYRVHKSPPLFPILSQIHPVHTYPHYFSKICSNIIFTFTFKSCERSIPVRLSDKFYMHQNNSNIGVV
jgi:hypothetical protein